MKIRKPFLEALNGALEDPQRCVEFLRRLPFMLRGQAYSADWARSVVGVEGAKATQDNPLEAYFRAHRQGRGIWKWLHYFEIYHRHLQRFVNAEVHVLEIGIYSGGSLDMWKQYFGPNCHLYGVDIEPACKAYEDARTRVFIGDQSDREFWASFKREVPRVDIVIDDGGHHPEQQITTLEEVLPHLRPGGVYLCEDVCGTLNGFSAYVRAMADNLNARGAPKDEGLGYRSTPFQSAIHSMHFYPFMTVIERLAAPLNELVAPKHGTEWQPFL